MDGVDKPGYVTIPRPIGSQTGTTVTKNGANLNAGIQRLRIEVVVGGFTLNWIEMARSTRTVKGQLISKTLCPFSSPRTRADR